MFDIDVVIRWAGSPSAVKAAKCERYGVDPGVLSVYTDDLRYCLRSVCKNMGWFRRLFLLVDDDEELPEWMDDRSARLTVVRHSQFIPGEFLPTWNSNVIDSYIHRVPELGERFVVLDDEMFVVKSASVATFYRLDGLPITRHYSGRWRHLMKKSPIGFVTMWQDAIRKWRLKYSRIQHHAQPFLRSVMERYERDVFGEALRESGKLRVRGRGDVNLLRFTSALMSERGDGHMIRTKDAFDWFLEGPELTAEKAREVMEKLPTFLCINNTHPDQTIVYDLLEKILGERSEFEQ